eukprot:290521_1
MSFIWISCIGLSFFHVITTTLRLVPHTFDCHMYLIWINQFLFYVYSTQWIIAALTYMYYINDSFLIISSWYVCMAHLYAIYPALKDLFKSYVCFPGTSSFSNCANDRVQTQIKIVSCNLLNVHPNPVPITTEIISIDADILLLQEFSPIWDQCFTQFRVSPDKYPYCIKRVRTDGFGVAIFSKYELIDANIFEIDTFPYCKAFVKLHNELVFQVFNVHMQQQMIWFNSDKRENIFHILNVWYHVHICIIFVVINTRYWN